MELREPKRKRVGAHIKPKEPFPIAIESENGIIADSDLWQVYLGNFTGDYVVVHNPEEMTLLYTMGFFGKGSFSRGYPSFGLSKKGIPPIIKERQWKRRQNWMEGIKNSIDSSLLPQGTDEPGQNVSNEYTVNITAQSSNKDTDMEVDEVNTDRNQGVIETKAETSLDLNSDLVNQVDASDSDIHVLNSRNKVLVLADSDDEDIEKVIRDPQPHLEDESIKTAVETLNLTLEEAFFLSYALGCLDVIGLSGQPLNLTQMWQTFCEAKPDFIEMYIAYHYFRAKGWVVKTGYKFGGDFLLYKQGPPFYHASFIVLVEKVNSKLERQKESLTWTKLHGLNRLSEGSGKDVIVCQVVFPDNLTSEDFKTPKSLSKFQVNELLIKRWIPSHERQDKEVIPE